MIKDKRIFDGETMVVNGNNVRVLTTPYHINRNEIPNELNVYALIKKGDHYMVDDINSISNTEDFEMSMISHIAVPLGSDIEIKHCDQLYGLMARISINEYFVETVGVIKLYVMMPTDDVASEEITKRLNAARRCFAIACSRQIDDIEILNKVNDIDPYDVDTNFESDVDRSIYRLTKRIRIMGNATHILDMSRSYGFVLRNPCSVEREVCEKYNLNRIDVATIDGVIRKMRKDNDDLKIIMGKTERIDNTKGRLNPAFVPPSPRPYFDDNPDPFGLYYTKL